MVRIHRKRPRVSSFILASTYELQNSPQKYAMSEASTMRGVEPKTVWNAAWWGQPGAGGKASTAQVMNEAKMSAPNPAHTTLRARA